MVFLIVCRAAYFGIIEYHILRGQKSFASFLEFFRNVESPRFNKRTGHYDLQEICNALDTIYVSLINEGPVNALLKWEATILETDIDIKAIRILRRELNHFVQQGKQENRRTLEGLSMKSLFETSHHVEQMGRDAEYGEIAVLPDLLQCKIRIHMLSHKSDEPYQVFDHSPSFTQHPTVLPEIDLLFQPGHYEILYTEDYC
mmetsp:Transcript_16874/g.18928  ORF Transcript_16874/g.18928 Transcript_16874/m.18928 type:complete len:201 (-) Transcript_16874:26-628(-)